MINLEILQTNQFKETLHNTGKMQEADTHENKIIIHFQFEK